MDWIKCMIPLFVPHPSPLSFYLAGSCSFSLVWIWNTSTTWPPLSPGYMSSPDRVRFVFSHLSFSIRFGPYPYRNAHKGSGKTLTLTLTIKAFSFILWGDLFPDHPNNTPPKNPNHQCLARPLHLLHLSRQRAVCSNSSSGCSKVW